MQVEAEDECLPGVDGALALPTGLESDLETILETDQESNYMTTARTNRPNQSYTATAPPTSTQLASTQGSRKPEATGSKDSPEESGQQSHFPLSASKGLVNMAHAGWQEKDTFNTEVLS